MASFSVDVREQVLNDDDFEEEEENIERYLTIDNCLESWFDSFLASKGFNRELFKELGMEMMNPLVTQCSVVLVSCSHRSKGRLDTIYLYLKL